MAGKTTFSAESYIENAFLDTKKTSTRKRSRKAKAAEDPKFRKTTLNAPRPRRAKEAKGSPIMNDELKQFLQELPRQIDFLSTYFTDDVTNNYYTGDFKESRRDLILRLLNPELSLEDVSRLLGVCPATVRRYTNRGWLEHHRTKGGQRRFRLSGVVKFVQNHGRHPEDLAE
jgi:excisionase family DNA binding protein